VCKWYGSQYVAVMKQNGLKTSFGRVDKKAPGARIIFSLSQLMQKITNIRTKYKLIFLCIIFSKFFLAIPVPGKFNPGCQHVLLAQP
jgi:hypothetical protein